FRVTDISAITDLTDGGYFAGLSESTFSYDARLWVRPNPDATGSTFDIGFGNMSSMPPVTTSTYNVGDDIFVVMAYNVDTGELWAWVNPLASDLGAANAPTPTIQPAADQSPALSISRFLLRQDSTTETPFILFDELRIGTTWASVTPTNTLAVSQQQLLDGFAMYPNPVRGGLLNIQSQSNTEKNINIYDVIGKRVFQKTTKANQINISNLRAGMYFVKVVQDGKIATRKLVVE
ncbi:MAG: T9SS type A sorting domain-containing protein, partial [Flavobacteriaceae bacterium]